MTNINHIRKQIKNHRAKFLGYKFESSVLLPLVYYQGQWQILYEIRSQYVSQPGEVSFPGGRIEKGESPLQAGLRETKEEIGFPVEKIEVLGEIDRIANGRVMVYCHVGILEDFYPDQLKINRYEVDSIFFKPVQYFIDNAPEIYHYNVESQFERNFPSNKFKSINETAYKRGRSQSSLPFYEFKEATLWGLTAQLTRHFANLVGQV